MTPSKSRSLHLQIRPSASIKRVYWSGHRASWDVPRTSLGMNGRACSKTKQSTPTGLCPPFAVTPETAQCLGFSSELPSGVLVDWLTIRGPGALPRAERHDPPAKKQTGASSSGSNSQTVKTRVTRNTPTDRPRLPTTPRTSPESSATTPPMPSKDRVHRRGRQPPCPDSGPLRPPALPLRCSSC